MVYCSGGAGTSGFNAKDKSTGKYGVVTAAHVATQGLTLYNALDAAIGKPTHWQNEKSMDAAFVPFSYDGFEPSMAINGDTSNKITAYVKVADIIKGMPVGMYGKTTAKDIGTSTGKVVEVSADFSILTRLVKCSYSSQSGDSGGPVYLTSANNGYAKNSIISIHRGHTSSYSYSTKVGYILVTFGLSLYTG